MSDAQIYDAVIVGSEASGGGAAKDLITMALATRACDHLVDRFRRGDFA